MRYYHTDTTERAFRSVGILAGVIDLYRNARKRFEFLHKKLTVTTNL